MKLHLPVRLFRAVMALLLAAPSALYAAYTAPTTITIPSGYTQVTVDALADITAYSSTAQDVAFRLDAASLPNGVLTISGRSSRLMTSSADSRYFTSYSPSSLASLTFSKATTQLFYVSSGESLQFTALQHLLFEGNTYSTSSSYADGGAINGDVTLSGNESVSFSGNTASSTGEDYSARGGAIYGDSITLSGNGSVCFSGNTASSTGSSSSAYGGSIYGYSTITLSDNESVSFSGNAVSSTGEYSSARGGAIFGDMYIPITLSGNGSVSFIGNTASSTGEYSSAYGGAIYGYVSPITLSGNESVSFSGNTASSTGEDYSARGGAIYGETITLSGNESVSFSGNTASSSDDDAYGGAIYGDMYSTITLSDNGSVTFSGNTARGHNSAHGGAIYGDMYSTITLSGNEIVSFSGNTASSSSGSAYGGAIYGGNASTITLSDNESVSFSGSSGSAIYGDRYSTITLSGNESVSFSGNTASSSDSDDADGGAIYGGGASRISLSNNGSVCFSKNSGGAIDGDSITLSGNGSVSFSGNTAASGGAIDGDSITLRGNGSVSFSENSAAYGGAIYGGYRSVITLSGNECVSFSDNTASSDSSAYGGAIYGYGYSVITLRGNGNVCFSGNTASISSGSAYGGAIYGDRYSTIITLSGNECVSFSENTVSGSSYAYGGAICGHSSSTITLSDNGSVIFRGNTASGSSYAYGGAICGHSSSTITLSDNGSVSFSGNTASSRSAVARGGAIYGDDTSSITLSGNGSVSFSGNTASTTGSSSYDAYGGAIYSSSTITLSGNESVSFSGNTASSSYDDAYGGAIYGYISSTITLSGNGSVTFSGNTASSSASSADGGAIYADGHVSIQNNDSVLFEKNVEQSGSAYRLRSIYAGGSGDVISLSAAAGKSIEFRDSVYIASDSTFHLNADYTDAAGVVHKQAGDILFTGAYTEADLLAVKGCAGTAAEILNSRTSEVYTLTHLYGGRLRVEDGAIYKGYGITTTTGSNATVSVKNATLNHDGYQLSFAEGTSLQAAGVSTITASSLNMADGSTLSFGISAENKDEAVLTLAGVFNLAGHLSVNLLFSEDLLATNEYKLFTVNNTPTWWTPENVSIQGDSNWNIDYDDLRWVDGTLVLKMELTDWTNENGNGVWSSSDSSGPQDGDIVLFDDAGSGIVQLEGELKPGFVLVNNGDAHDYTWTGDGYLSGEMILQKRGEGSLTIETQNQYSGGTVLEAGRLVAGHEMAFGSGKICVKGGELDANHVAIANDILATGGTLSGLDNYAGSLTVDGDVSLSEGITTAQQLIHKSGTLSGGSVSGSNLLILGGTQDFTLVGENTLMDGSVLSQALHNEGVLTLDGQIDVSQLELHYEAAGRVNVQGDEIAMSESGFGKAFYYGVQLTDGAGTVVDGGASITHEETDYTLTLQSNGVASYGGEVDYSHFFLEGNDCYGVSALEAQTGVNLRMVSMSSGTLDVDDDVKVQATGGSIHIVRDAKLCGLVEHVALTVSAAADVRADIKGTSSLALANAQVRLSGENSFNGGISSQGESQLSVESADPLLLAQSISNTGTLSLSGAFELSQLAKESLPTMWVNAAGIVGESGFSIYGGYTVQMVQGGNVKDAGVILTSGLDTLKLGEDGVATRKADVDYSHYAVATGDVVSISEINRVATGNGCALTSISTTGGRLTLDADVSGSLTLDSGNLIMGKNTVVVSDTLTLGTELQVTLTDTYTGGLVYTLIEAEAIEGKCEGWEISSSPRQTYTLYIEDNALKMLVEGDVAWLTWANDKKAVWREAAGGWQNGESFYQGDHATIGDGTVTIEGVVKPSSILLNPTKSLTFKTKFDKKTGLWSGAIAGETEVTIAAGPKGKVTMNDGNTYTGETIIESGTVSVGGVDSFGESDITLEGGTLDLKSKAVDNAITLTDSAAIKGGAKYTGEFTLNGGELQKGSVLNVADTAILESGVMNGTLSGTGIVYVTGDVQLGDAAKLTTNGLNISGKLEVGSKGLTMNAKSSAISISGGTLASEGKLSAASLTMVGGALDVSNAKPMTVTLTGVADLSAGATVNIYGAFTAADLDMNGATFTLAMDDGYITPKSQPKVQKITLKDKNATSELTNGSELDITGSMTVAGGLTLSDSTLSLHDWEEATKPKAQTLTVKGALEVIDSELSLNGKLTAASLAASGTDITLENETAAQSIALTLAKDTQKQVVVNTLTESTIDATGSMTVAGALALTDSSISLHDVGSAAKPKAMGLTVKDALSIADTAKDATAELTLTGKLSAARLTLDKADIKLENETAAQSIALTLAKDTQKQVVVNTLTDSTIDATGSMTVAGALALTDSSIYLHDVAGATKPKAMGLTVKGDMSMLSYSYLSLSGKLSANSLQMGDSAITLQAATAQSITLSGKNITNEFTNSDIYANGSMSVTGNLSLKDSTVGLVDDSLKPKAQTLTVKGALDITDADRDAAANELYLTGKLTAGSLNMTNADIRLENEQAAQSISLTLAKDAQKQAITNTLTDSGIYANGSMSVTGHLALSGASFIHLEDTAKGKAMNLAVKGDLTLGSGSSLTLSGALSAANMKLNGGSINLTSTKLQTIKVSKELTFGGSITLGLQAGLDIKMGKSYNLFTYKTLVGVNEDTNLYTLLGLEDKYCTLTLDSKKKAITLMVTEEEWSKWVSDHTQTTEEVPEVATASIAEDAASMTTSAAVEEEPSAEEQETATVITTLPVAQAVDVEELIAKVSDTLVQTTWGTAKASRAFVDSIANRGQNATALAEGCGAAWGGVIGATSRLSSHGGSLGADHTLSGAVFGAEMNAGTKHSLGMAMGVTWGEINTLSAYNVDQDSTHFALYGQSRLMQNGKKGLTLDWSAAYGRSENDADMLGSSYDWTQHALQLDARLTYGYALNERTTLRGFGGVQYLHIDSDTPEKGVKADSMQNVRVEVGVGATYMATAKTAVYGEVSFIGDMVRDNPATHIGGVCRGGSNPGRAGMNLSVGATHALNESWSLNASYNMELQPRANAHNANIGATYRF